MKGRIEDQDYHEQLARAGELSYLENGNGSLRWQTYGKFQQPTTIVDDNFRPVAFGRVQC